MNDLARLRRVGSHSSSSRSRIAAAFIGTVDGCHRPGWRDHRRWLHNRELKRA